MSRRAVGGGPAARIAGMFVRALIVLLLVLNLGVAAWWGLGPAPAAPSPPTRQADAPRLRLVGEPAPAPAAPAAKAGAAAPPAVPPAAAAPAGGPAAPAPGSVPSSAAAASGASAAHCFALGPFDDQGAAEAARATLQARARRVLLRDEPLRRRGRHWDVLMPPQADRAAAQALAQRIEAAGFKDYYVIGSGDGANGIALGRFGSEEAARRHQAMLREAGFAVQVRPPDAGTRYWLDIAAGEDLDPEQARREVAARRASPADCTTLG